MVYHCIIIFIHLWDRFRLLPPSDTFSTDDLGNAVAPRSIFYCVKTYSRLIQRSSLISFSRLYQRLLWNVDTIQVSSATCLVIFKCLYWNAVLRQSQSDLIPTASYLKRTNCVHGVSFMWVWKGIYTWACFLRGKTWCASSGTTTIWRPQRNCFLMGSSGSHLAGWWRPESRRLPDGNNLWQLESRVLNILRNGPPIWIYYLAVWRSESVKPILLHFCVL